MLEAKKGGEEKEPPLSQFLSFPLAPLPLLDLVVEGAAVPDDGLAQLARGLLDQLLVGPAGTLVWGAASWSRRR